MDGKSNVQRGYVTEADGNVRSETDDEFRARIKQALDLDALDALYPNGPHRRGMDNRCVSCKELLPTTYPDGNPNGHGPCPKRPPWPCPATAAGQLAACAAVPALVAELRTARATIAAAVPCDAADKAVMRLPCDHANLRAKLAEQAATIAEMESELTAHRALRARLEPLVAMVPAEHHERCDDTYDPPACDRCQMIGEIGAECLAALDGR